jgi:hypothetical protein
MGGIKDKEKLAEICGAMIGDGWIQSNEQSFFLAGDPKEDKDYYDNHISKLISKLIVPVKPKEFLYWKVYGISIHTKSQVKKLLDLGLPKGKKVKTAEVPRWIIEADLNTIKSFIRGFFDTDGCVFCQKDYTKYAKEFESKYHTKIRIRISSVSKKLIEEVFLLCKKCGFRCVKRVKIINRVNRADVHILEVNEIKGIHRWFNELKPSNPKHTTKYLVWKKHGFCPPYTTIKQRKDILKKKINPYKLYKQE